MKLVNFKARFGKIVPSPSERGWGEVVRKRAGTELAEGSEVEMHIKSGN